MENEPRKPKKIRFSKEEENHIQTLANIYAGGNFSKWVRWAAINAPRKIIKKGDV